MNYNIRMGLPQMNDLWEALCEKHDTNSLKGADKNLFKKLIKVFNLLRQDPRYPSLNTHEIKQLTKRYGLKVWQSYLENRVPAAGRIYWVYGPNKNDITVIGLEPHPNDKTDSYKKIPLDRLAE